MVGQVEKQQRGEGKTKGLPISKNMIHLQRVQKTYPNGCQCLIDLNLTLKKGDFLFITGASGAGKSTLLKLISGQEKVDRGEIFVDGENIKTLDNHQLAYFRRRLGIIFQDYKLISNRTVKENIAFVLQSQGMSRSDIEQRLHPAVRLVGLQHKLECFPHQLSGGEQQRVSIARAIVHTPPIILADEPTGNLDPDNSFQVLKILEKLHSFGATIVVCTHDERMVMMSNYPVAQIRNGRLYRVRN